MHKIIIIRNNKWIIKTIKLINKWIIKTIKLINE